MQAIHVNYKTHIITLFYNAFAKSIYAKLKDKHFSLDTFWISDILADK